MTSGPERFAARGPGRAAAAGRAGFPARLAAYWELPRQPLYALAFLAPIVLLYEFGVWFAPPPAHSGSLVAQALLDSLAGWIGVTGPGVAGVLVLLTLGMMHFAVGKARRFRPSVPAWMLLESLVVAVPLFVLHRLLGSFAAAPAAPGRFFQILGAGVFEEFVFRLALVGGLWWLLRNRFHLRRSAAVMVAVAAGAALFAAAHIQPIGAEPLAWRVLTLRFLAGAYLGLLFLWRSVGISTGAHILSNLAALLHV